MKRYSILFFLLTILIFQSCKKDLVDPYDAGTNESAVINAQAILVQIVDENGVALSDVDVNIGDYFESTDANGVVQFSDIMVPSLNATIVSKKSGYFTGNYVFNSSENEQISVQMTLSSKVTSSINGSNGGRVDCEGGAFIEFPADGFLTLDGSVYDGSVLVSSKFVNTNINKNLAPNSFAGMNEKGEDVFVDNHSVLVVELTDESGNELIVNPKNKAELHLPIGTEDLSSAPSKLPLYYFHEGLGKWIEDGSAKKKDDFYVGDVEHFTFWSCPYVYDHYLLSGKFECSGTPYAGATVNVYNPWGHKLGSTTTNVVGGFSGSIPATLTLTLEVEDACGGVIYSEEIGPFSSNTNLGTMDLCSGTSVNYGIVEGTITDCAGSPDTQAYLSVQFDGKIKYLPANTLGAFNQAIIFCSSTSEVTFMGVNSNNNSASTEITIPASTSMDFGNLQVCDTPDQYCSYTYNGDQYFLVPNAIVEFYAILEFTDTLQSNVGVWVNAQNNQGGGSISHFSFAKFFPSVGLHQMPGNSGLGGFVFENKFGQVGDNVPINLTYVGSSIGDYLEGEITAPYTYDNGWGGTSTIGPAEFRIEITAYNP
ncbi:MAG: hypothetical protein ABJG68_08090 [Crocinitomicaceae bacterium]